MRLLATTLITLLPLSLFAQEPNPMQSVPPSSAGQTVTTNGAVPIFRVEVVSRSLPAVSYRNRSGWTKVDFEGTDLAPQSKGEANVNSQLGHMEIKLDVKHLPAARSFGPLFLTYVLWAITPDGHPSNLGEVVVNSDGDYKGTVTTDLQAFGLIITAEPYFDVHEPSDVVVMQNVIRTDTMGKWEVVNAKYELLPRGVYAYQVPAAQLQPIDLNSNKKSPLELYEAMNAIHIAKYARADQFASETYNDAEKLLQQAETYQADKQWNPSIMTAKEAVQKAEDARIISLRQQQQLALAQERQQAAEKQAAAQQAAQAAELRAQQEAQQRQQAEQQAQLAAQQTAAAEQAKAAAEQAKQEADAARAEAAAEAQKAQQSAAEADRLRAQAEQEKNQLREQLLQQFNAVLPTIETTRGLVVNMQDVLFATSQYTLKENAKLALAKISGIIASHPGLNLQVEGYTDSTGTAAFNQKLSEERANAVRDFLMQQGVSGQVITSVGYGEQYPVASNDTASGRQMNRRVELVVSGQVIGFKIGTPPSAAPAGQMPGANPPQNPPQK